MLTQGALVKTGVMDIDPASGVVREQSFDYDFALIDLGGKRLDMKDLKGKVIFLNLWATWCVPCREEMPALDALQQKLGGPNFEVVAINIDTRDPNKPKAWLKEVGIDKLAYYADPQAKAFQDLKSIGRAFGMPTTLLIDRAGREIGRLVGPAEWDAPGMIAFIRRQIGQQ